VYIVVKHFSGVDSLESETEGVERLFTELSSQTRLAILRELQSKPLRMQETARKLNLTDTETFRQLQRLCEATLIQKKPDGTYNVTNYGRLMTELSPSMEFAFKHKKYFLEHDIWKLPHPFITRLGDLSKANLNVGLAENVNRLEEMTKSAQEYVWSMTDQNISSLSHAMAERLLNGVKFRSIIHEKMIGTPLVQLTSGKNSERRTLPDIPAILVITEKEACLSLFLFDGRTDYAAFFGQDPIFLRWVIDLFVYCWDRANPLHQIIKSNAPDI